jgi:hypothetical protein
MEKMKSREGAGSARIVDVHIRKKGFPAGMFLLLFALLLVVAGGAVMVYFLHAGRGEIGTIEAYTKDYSVKLVNTYAGAAELGYRKGGGDRLTGIFGDPQKKETYEEAFFVLNDGTLVAHSFGDTLKELRGNMYNDEIAYNADLILKAARQRSAGVNFSDYNIVTLRIPFNRMEREMLKQYLYAGIDTSGWLVSKAVYIKGEPVGTVNLIVGKDRIFQAIRSRWGESLRLLLVSAGAAFMLSFIMALVLFMRYRAIQQDALDQAGEKMEYRHDREEERSVEPEEAEDEFERDVVLEDDVPAVEPIAVELFDEKKAAADEGGGRVIDLYSARREREDRGGTFPAHEEKARPAVREIKEAIPLARKRNT